YQGRCVMTPTAGQQLDANLRNFLLKTTLDDCRDRTAGGEGDYIKRLVAWFATKPGGAPPHPDAEQESWLKQQRPFVDKDKRDENGNPCLLPSTDLLTWYAQKPVAGANNTVGNASAVQQAADPVYSAIRALDRVGGMSVLSQALGGFNAALMTRRQVLQIPIENPMEGELPRALRNLRLTASFPHAVGATH